MMGSSQPPVLLPRSNLTALATHFLEQKGEKNTAKVQPQFYSQTHSHALHGSQLQTRCRAQPRPLTVSSQDAFASEEVWARREAPHIARTAPHHWLHALVRFERGTLGCKPLCRARAFWRNVSEVPSFFILEWPILAPELGPGCLSMS